MEEKTTIAITVQARTRMGKLMTKDEEFSDFLNKLMDKWEGKEPKK